MIFILLGNAAANCIAFAINLLQLCGRGNDKYDSDGKSLGNDDIYSMAYRFQVTAVAIGSSVTVCFVHAMWRKWGIRINNVFAVAKILIMVSIIIFAFVAAAHNKGNSKNFSYSHDDTEARQYGVSLLYVVFSYGGWNQANYVRGRLTPFGKTCLVQRLTVANPGLRGGPNGTKEISSNCDPHRPGCCDPLCCCKCLFCE